ncbi:MAG: hypothetical protein IH986_10765 [Planctomycetes bacterium]|nr:hypothetical protein [Planctomycetota bacterium]
MDHPSKPGRPAAATIALVSFFGSSWVIAQPCPRWDPGAMGDPGLDNAVRALGAFDDGNGSALYAGGGFRSAGNNPISFLAKWDGQDWSDVGGGANSTVNGLGVFDDGAGTALYVTGNFTSVGRLSASRIARWDGGAWSSLGSGLDRSGRAFLEFDDGSGRALYVAGFFFIAGGVPGTGGIARWDGQQWTSVGGGMDGTVNTMVVFDDGAGGGPALYAGGTFTRAGGVPGILRVARWDGQQWFPLAEGMDGGGNPRVNALAVYDSGSGPALYAAGNFTLAGNAAVSNMARWDGSSWSDVAGGTDDTITALQVFDDGGGDELFVGGTFLTAGVVEVGQIAKWNGSTWAGVGEFGLAGGVITSASALTVLDDGGGPALYVAGGFDSAGGINANNITRWVPCPSFPPGDMNCDGRLDGGDIDPFFLALGDPAAYTAQFPNCNILNGDMNRDGRLDGGDIDPFFACLGGGPCP